MARGLSGTGQLRSPSRSPLASRPAGTSAPSTSTAVMPGIARIAFLGGVTAARIVPTGTHPQVRNAMMQNDTTVAVAAAPPMRPAGKAQLVLLLAGSCMAVLGSVLIAPVLPQLAARFADTPGVDLL